MTLEEFHKSIIKAGKELESPTRNGVCSALHKAFYIGDNLFGDIFRPNIDENYKWNSSHTCYWLGNGQFDSLSYKYKLNTDITRFIALGFFEQIVIDEKLYPGM